MNKIAVLDQNTIDKIAAGEVVERPASVVKELVENAIDAGSTAITVEIKEGGISFIRITDNGNGIPKDQVKLAFLRHATSKIEKVEDLTVISSLGFRGEALSSISAVSQVELITKTHRDLTGTRYIIEGGIEKSIEEIGAPCGTTFLVRNLFFNTPVRSKFLKTAATEAGYVSNFIEQLALSHYDISFKYIVNGQTKLHSSGNSNLKDVIYSIYGRDITKELLEVHWEEEGLSIDGFIGKPSLSRGNRNFENYYVNGRYVKSKIITKAVEDSYKTFMMQHKYPFTALHITLDGESLDINVHPTKMEIRFWQGEVIYDGVCQAIAEAFHKKEMIPVVALENRKAAPAPKDEKKSVPEPFEQNRREVLRERTSYHTVSSSDADHKPPVTQNPTEAPKPILTDAIQKNTIQKDSAAKSSKRQTVILPDLAENTEPKTEQLELFQDKMLSKEARIHHKLIGQLFDTYWLVEYDSKFYIMDQHAAHEKVLYERIMKELENKEIQSQFISPPMVVALNLQESELLMQYMDLFHSFGFEIEPFGGKEYSIRAVPSNLYGITKEELFIEVLDHLEGEALRQPPEIITRKLAMMACKAAVKGNQSLSLLEADALIEELLSLENPYHCPHGRPTIIAMTKYELEKKFKRIV